MPAWNAPKLEPGAVSEANQWARPPVPPAKVPADYAPSHGHAAARRLLGFALFLLFVGAIGVGAWFYFKSHPFKYDEAATSTPRALPRSGDSPSAYRYIMGRLGRRTARSNQATATAAPGGQTDGGTVTIEGMSFKLSDSVDDFLAEVIDGDRHYFIRFRRVPRLVVTTKDPASMTPSANALRVASAEPAGEEVYLSQNGWWRLTRPQNVTEKAVAASVVLNVFLTPDGHVERADVVSGTTEMAAAALEAVKHWRYDAPSAGAPAQKRIVVNFSVAPQ